MSRTSASVPYSPLNRHHDDDEENFSRVSVSAMRRSGTTLQSTKVATFTVQEEDTTEISYSGDSLEWWKPVAWMLGLLALGLAFSIGHHLAYTALSGQPIDSYPQTWIHNAGNATAFVVKTSFTLAAGLAFWEVLWFSVRRTAMKVSTIDGLFTLLGNPLSFLSIDALRNAPLVTLIATIAWTIPLSAILSPGTLNVASRTLSTNSSCIIPTFPANDSVFYATVPHGVGVTGANEAIRKVADQIFPQGNILESPSPCGSNCSFQHTFSAPALRCEDAEYGGLPPGASQFTAYRSDPASNWTYSSNMDISITYQDSADPEPLGKYPDSLYRKLVCSAYNATYDLNVTYALDVPQFTPTITYHNKLLNLSEIENSIPGNSSSRVNFVVLVREIFENYLDGTFQGSPTAENAVGVPVLTPIITTSLAGSVDIKSGNDMWQVHKDFKTGIPELLTNLTLSTLSMNAANETVQCTTSTSFQAYKYEPFWLVVSYAVALGITLIACGTGVMVLSLTGMRTGGMFSQILVTTRNPRLDVMARGNSLSSSGAKALGEQSIRLGELKEVKEGPSEQSKGTGHAAFGPKEQVMELKKSKMYH